MMIQGKQVGPNQPAFLIGEMGINHNGDVKLAICLVEEAARAGVDAVKIQLVDAAKDYTKGSTSYETFKAVSLTLDEWKRVATCARSNGVAMFASFARAEMIGVSRDLGFPAVKISSGNLTNYPLLKAVGASGLPVIVSTGMSSLEEVRSSVMYLEAQGAKDIAVLHCTSLYPAPLSSVNLRAICTMMEAFPRQVIGWSDHTEGIALAPAAVALGAVVLEKHYTVDKSLPGPEHGFSVTIDELTAWVQSVRAMEVALGTGVKAPDTNELPLRTKLRSTLMAAQDLTKGDVLKPEDLVAMRADVEGIGAECYESLLGRVIQKDMRAGEPMTEHTL